MTEPQAGEVWRNGKGAVREVRSVEAGYSVAYTRPAPAPHAFTCVSIKSWQDWVDKTNGQRLRKAEQANSDWSYITK